MIFDALILLGNTVLGLIIPIFPISSGFPNAVMSGATYLGNMVSMFNPLVPVGTLATILGLIVSMEVSIFAFKTFKWLFSHIPFIGGKG